jgi:biotin carboxyl carrier protein
MPGTVVRIAAGVGQPVRAGTTVVVFEAMKMEHPVKAPAAGTVAEVLVEVGQTVDAGEALAVIVETMEDL